ncbi:MAG TPA: reverse transcriptase family protein, partial [Nitrospiraceae bacterium]
KKTGQGLRIVQDFRALNSKTKIDKYSMKDISECIGDIGRAGSSIFTTIDLTSGFWQMPLHPKDSHLTAFTVKGKGQFEWVTSPMGLLGCPASFQRLMEHVLEGTKNILIYVDDVIIHTADHDHHLVILDETLTKLERHGLKINLDKCYFGNQKVAYLGFTLTPTGIEPGKEKLKLVKEYKEPTNLREVRAFVGLCNFFRNHIKNFAQLSSPLTKLCRNDSGYDHGPLPADARRAFELLQQALGSGPSLAFPRRNRKYVLVTEAYPPTDDSEGGLSATLCQLDEAGKYHILSHGSRQLLSHERRYPHFLLEMLAALYGMEYFDEHLRGRIFNLLMDERPVEELSHLHKKTLARFKASMDNYQFLLQQKTSSRLPLELRTASTWCVNSLGPRLHRLRDLQQQDPDLLDCLHFRQHQSWPSSLPKDKADLLRGLNSSMFLDEEGIMWVRCKERTAAFIPAALRVPITCQLIRNFPHLVDPKDLHQKLIESSYIWPGAILDIKDHLRACQDCINHRSRPKPTPCTPNQRVVLQTFGPLPSYGTNKFIMVLRDEATGYTEFTAVENRQPSTLAEALITSWIAKLSLPGTLITGLSTNDN